jgi:hypothetical protein
MIKVIAKSILGKELATMTLPSKQFSKINKFKNKISVRYGTTVAIEIIELNK